MHQTLGEFFEQEPVEFLIRCFPKTFMGFRRLKWRAKKNDWDTFDDFIVATFPFFEQLAEEYYRRDRPEWLQLRSLVTGNEIGKLDDLLSAYMVYNRPEQFQTARQYFISILSTALAKRANPSSRPRKSEDRIGEPRAKVTSITRNTASPSRMGDSRYVDQLEAQRMYLLDFEGEDGNLATWSRLVGSGRFAVAVRSSRVPRPIPTTVVLILGPSDSTPQKAASSRDSRREGRVDDADWDPAQAKMWLQSETKNCLLYEPMKSRLDSDIPILTLPFSLIRPPFPRLIEACVVWEPPVNGAPRIVTFD